MSETQFEARTVGFAIITYYPRWYNGKLRSIKHTDKVRGDLAIEFAQKAVKAGYTIVYVDGKSSRTFRKSLQDIQGLRVIKRFSPGRSPSKRQAIKFLTKIPAVKAIVLCEPEKVSFLTDCLHDAVSPILSGKADIVVPRRNDRMFKSSYPLYMYESEIECNSIYNETLRTNGIEKEHMHDLDMCFGPRVLKNDKEIISLFMRRYRLKGESLLGRLYDPEEYSNVQFFPIINALRKGLKVIDIEVPFVYPKIQKENEEIGARTEFIFKRSNQRVSLLIDLMHFLSFLSRKRTSRLKEVIRS